MFFPRKNVVGISAFRRNVVRSDVEAQIKTFFAPTFQAAKKEQIGVKEVVAAGDTRATGHELFQIVIGQEAKPLILSE